MKNIYTISIILSGILWGTMGVFSTALSQFGFSSLQGTAIRLTICAIVLCVINFKNLKIKLCDLWMFALLGIASLFLMSYSYFESIKCNCLSVAAILLYTSPIMVTVMAWAFLKEKMTPVKILSLVLAFSGVVMISGLDASSSISAKGIFFGLLSAFAYSLYSIIGKFVLKKYSVKTTTTYAFVFAAFAALVFSNFGTMLSTVSQSADKLNLFAIMLGTGVITAAIPYTLYTIGLNHICAGKASVLACVEPLTATFIGIVFYSEKLGMVSFLGMILILTSVTILSFLKE